MSHEEERQDTPENRAQDEAARKLQKLWRGRNDARDRFLTPNVRWNEVVEDSAIKVCMC